MSLNLSALPLRTELANHVIKSTVSGNLRHILSIVVASGRTELPSRTCVTGRSPTSARRNVDFPLPLGPTKPTTSPLWIVLVKFLDQRSTVDGDRDVRGDRLPGRRLAPDVESETHSTAFFGSRAREPRHAT